MAALETTANQILPLVFPVHPRTRAALADTGHDVSAELTLLDPQSYLDMIALIESAAVVITDSGGVQKEAAFLHTPCVTVRRETEWNETIELGVNCLVDDAIANLANAVDEILNRRDIFDADTIDQIKAHFGAGDAANRIVADCVDWAS